MSRLWLSSDLHLGHKNICKYRTTFSSEEEHSNILFDNLASSVGKRDTLYLLGDVAFTPEWLKRVSEIRCHHKKLICGNHDRDFHTMAFLVEHFDSVDCLMSKRNCWFSHAPIHPQEIRRRLFNIHGHLHHNLVTLPDGSPDLRYINVCPEHHNWMPVTFDKVTEWQKSQQN